MTSQNTTTPFLRGERRKRQWRKEQEEERDEKSEEKKGKKNKMPAGVHVAADCVFWLIMT